MLFRNLTSGNLVNATNESTIALMKSSSNYEAVKPRGKKDSQGGGKDTGEGTKEPDKTTE